jgi:hypothetical protein
VSESRRSSRRPTGLSLSSWPASSSAPAHPFAVRSWVRDAAPHSLCDHPGRCLLNVPGEHDRLHQTTWSGTQVIPHPPDRVFHASLDIRGDSGRRSGLGAGPGQCTTNRDDPQQWASGGPHASAKTTLDTYSHLWPDSDDSTRAAIDAAMAARAVAPADSLRTEAGVCWFRRRSEGHRGLDVVVQFHERL